VTFFICFKGGKERVLTWREKEEKKKKERLGSEQKAVTSYEGRGGGKKPSNSRDRSGPVVCPAEKGRYVESIVA